MRCPLCSCDRAHRSSRSSYGLFRLLRWAVTAVRCSACGHRYLWPTLLLGALAPPPSRRYPADPLFNQNGAAAPPVRQAPAKKAIAAGQLTDPVMAALARQDAAQRAELIGLLTILPTADGLLPLAQSASQSSTIAQPHGITG